VFGQDSLKAEQKVGLDGTLTLPLVGQISVLGKQASAVAGDLTTRLRPFVNDPRVTVIMHEAQLTITVVGEVANVGLIQLEPPASVLQAIARAGGFGPFANRSKIFVLRQNGPWTLRVRFTYQSLLDGDRAATAFRLRNGDTLVVE
jgi:polysaccharide export outer membrane protein